VPIKAQKHSITGQRFALKALTNFILVGLLCFLSATAVLSSEKEAAQLQDQTSGEASAEQQLIIEVNGQALIGPFSSPQRRGTRIFLPVVSIAKALGDTLTVKPSARAVEIRRQTGEVVELDLELKQIRENGSVVLSFTDSGDITFTSNAEELMLPIEWMAALFGASVHIDNAVNVIRILKQSSSGFAASRAGEAHENLEIYNVDYDYNFNSFAGFNNHNLTLRSTGRIGNGRFNLITHSGSGNNNLIGPLRGGTLFYENENEQKLMAGDVGTGSDLQFLTRISAVSGHKLPSKELA
jgi:hypothetical protein